MVFYISSSQNKSLKLYFCEDFDFFFFIKCEIRIYPDVERTSTNQLKAAGTKSGLAGLF